MKLPADCEQALLERYREGITVSWSRGRHGARLSFINNGQRDDREILDVDAGELKATTWLQPEEEPAHAAEFVKPGTYGISAGADGW